MPIQILSNLNYPIGNIINQELQNAMTARMAVAFVKYSGIKIIEQALKNCLKNNGSIEIIAGLDFKTTDPLAMRYLIQVQRQTANLKFYCYGDRGENKTSIIFHPKIYLFQNKKEMTGIVGSTNLTKGGLLTNFEANVIFKEPKPLYFSQLEAIYNSVKFTESVFSPNDEYLAGYSDVYRAFLRNEKKASKDRDVQQIIEQIQKKEQVLPGTIPSIKSLIIQVIKSELEKGLNSVSLNSIYRGVERLVSEKKLSYKMDTFRNSIRGELNKHEKNSKHPDNMNLFIRASGQKGYYFLTDKGKSYVGR